jgi:hypothetical protein
LIRKIEVLKEPIAASVGFLVAPLIPALAIIFLSPPLPWRHSGLNDVDMLFQYVLAGYGITLLFIYPFIIPAYYFAKRRNLIFWWSSSLTGILAGTMFTAVFFMQCWSHVSCIQLNLFGILAPIIVGGIAGIIFWVIRKTLSDKIELTENELKG